MTDETPDAPGPDDGLPEHVRALLAAPAAPEGVLDRARAAALDAFDEVHGSGGDATVAPVRELGSAGSARRAWYQRVPLSAAAAVIAVVALVGVLTQVDLGSSDGDDMATAELDDEASADAGGGSAFSVGDSAEESADDGFSLAPETDEESVDAGSGADGEAAPTAGSMRAVFVYEDVDALVEDYRRRFGDDPADAEQSAPPQTTSTGAAEYDASTCDPVDAADVDPDRVLSVDPVQLGPDDEPSTAFAVVYESEASGLRVAVVDEASCEPLADRAL